MTFITAHIGEIIVFVLSGILAFATERWFPTADVAQKKFWAAVLFIFSMVLGLSVNGAFGMNSKMERLAVDINDLKELERSEAGAHVVSREYEQIIANASRTLRKWGEDSHKALADDLKAGYIPISRELAPTTIAGVYDDARINIIASNVGSIDFYFDVPAYRQQNLVARDHHVPIVRFFIYSSSNHRQVKLARSCMNEGLKPDSIDDFSRCVKELNSQLGSICSVVVDYDKQFQRIGEAKDLLIMDNSFVAETELYSENWQPKRAKATEAKVSADEVNKDRTFFHNLWGITGDTCTGSMDEKDIPIYFPQFKGLKPKPNQHLADAAFQQILEQVTGPQ